MVCSFIFQGRNDLAVHAITREYGYLTWEDAYLCLTADLLPDCIRAKYCELIIGKLTVYFVSDIGIISIINTLQAHKGVIKVPIQLFVVIQREL